MPFQRLAFVLVLVLACIPYPNGLNELGESLNSSVLEYCVHCIATKVSPLQGTAVLVRTYDHGYCSLSHTQMPISRILGVSISTVLQYCTTMPPLQVLHLQVQYTSYRRPRKFNFQFQLPVDLLECTPSVFQYCIVLS